MEVGEGVQLKDALELRICLCAGHGGGRRCESEVAQGAVGSSKFARPWRRPSMSSMTIIQIEFNLH